MLHLTPYVDNFLNTFHPQVLYISPEQSSQFYLFICFQTVCYITHARE